MYDFSSCPNRRGTGAEKWASVEEAGIEDPAVIPLSIADMELPVAPEITRGLIAAATRGTCGYTVATDDYRRAVCNFFTRRHGWTPQGGWMVNTFGVVHAMLMAVHAFTAPGDGVVCQTPGYPPFRNVVQNTGRQLLQNPLLRRGTRYELDFDGLEALCQKPTTKLLFFCSPHNPVGRVWSREELDRVAEICLRNHVILFCDEIHCDFVYPPFRHIPMALLGEAVENNLVLATSQSKTFNLAGLATANIFIPNPQLRAQFSAQADAHTGSFNSYFGLCAGQVAYEECDGWLDELLVHLRGNYDYCKEFLAEKFPSIVVFPMEGTYLLWADFTSLGLTPEDQAKFLQEDALLYLDEGTMFGTGGAGCERVNLACTRRVLEDAMARLDAAATRRGLPR